MGPQDCSIAALEQMEAEAAMELPWIPYHYLAALDLQREGLATEVEVVGPALQLDFGRQTHVILGPIPLCIFGRS